MIILVDTSIWSLWLRRSKAPLAAGQLKQVQALQEIVVEGRSRLLGSVRQELLSGIRSWQQFLRLRQYLQAFPDVPLVIEDYEDAAQIGNTCRTQGVAVSATDMLICAVALRRGWAILSSDRDFERYAKHVKIELYS